MASKEARKLAKAQRKAFYAKMREQADEMAKLSLAVHGCACAWCCYREYQVLGGKADPGISLANSANDCKEPITVSLRDRAKVFGKAAGVTS